MSITLEKEKTVLHGTFRGGVIVLDEAVELPEGTAVTVRVAPQDWPDEMAAEFADWDRAGADAWQLIAEWEREEGQSPETVARIPATFTGSSFPLGPGMNRRAAARQSFFRMTLTPPRYLSSSLFP